MQETLATTAVVDWLNGRARGFNASGAQVTAPWSTGNVGMIGISYNGTLPNMAATTGVAGLKAIVPISAISSWYDYYRANGLVVAPGGYQGEDADVLAECVVTRPDRQLAPDRPDRDRPGPGHRRLQQFWHDRDYVGNADKVTAGVFVIHGLRLERQGQALRAVVGRAAGQQRAAQDLAAQRRPRHDLAHG